MRAWTHCFVLSGNDLKCSACHYIHNHRSVLATPHTATAHHLPRSSDLSPCSVALFHKRKLKNCYFDRLEEILLYWGTRTSRSKLKIATAMNKVFANSELLITVNVDEKGLSVLALKADYLKRIAALHIRCWHYVCVTCVCDLAKQERSKQATKNTSVVLFFYFHCVLNSQGHRSWLLMFLKGWWLEIVFVSKLNKWSLRSFKKKEWNTWNPDEADG